MNARSAAPRVVPPGSKSRAPARALAVLALAAVFACACGGPRGQASGESFLDDRAGLMDEAGRRSVEAWHAALLGQYDIDYRVLTLPAGEDLLAFSVRHFEEAGVGRRSGTGRGLLLVVDAGQGRVRLEVARELEHVYPDAFVAFVEREQMAPFFAAGRVGDGIVAASELVAGRAEEALASAALSDRPRAASSAGAGAETAATIGAGYARPEAVLDVDAAAASGPLETVAAYLAAMAAHDAAADLDLYTPASREMMAGHVVTRAQMDNVVRTYRACPPARVRSDGDFAVVDHPGEAGSCSPWLLLRAADGKWRLDLRTMQQVFRFDTRNRWRLVHREALGGFAFAFDE